MKTEEPLSATVEEYLETIYNMAMEGEVVIGARLAEKFRVSPPTVTEMLKRLVRDGYVEMDNKRQVTLTEAGNQAAEAVLRRHRLTERFLVDMLGMQWHQVHEEACRLEHFISARTYLKDLHAVRLSALAVGQSAIILCISEVVEDEEALVLYMHEKGLTPGTQITVLAPDDPSGEEQEENIMLQVDRHEVYISKSSAAKIWVTLV